MDRAMYIIENNKLIAEFMGARFRYLENVNLHQVNFKKTDSTWKSIVDLCYNSSWDWLMPVVERIEKEYTVKIIRYSDEVSNVCEIETTEEIPLQITYNYSYDYDGKTKINIVYEAVIEFIKWYNENK